MASMALDLTSIGQALNELSEHCGAASRWRSTTTKQKRFCSWYARYRYELDELDGIEALASSDYAELNQFLDIRGFEPVFEPLLDVGVVSVIDIHVEWVAQGEHTTIDGGSVVYPAFSVDPAGVDIYEVKGEIHPLVRLRTKTGHGLWLMKSTEPDSGMELAILAQSLASKAKMISREFAGAEVPMLEMSIRPDMRWLVGLKIESYRISKAVQQFKLRANDKGARVKVATSGWLCSACPGMIAPPLSPYVFDEPFIGFFTQPNHERLALAAFWADTDVWRNPDGTIEEL